MAGPRPHGKEERKVRKEIRKVNTENKTKRFMVLIVAFALGGMILVLAARLMGMGSMVYQQQRFIQWTDELGQFGPWATESVWATEKKDAYLVGQELKDDEGKKYTKVYAFFAQEDGSWETADFAPAKGADKAVFTFAEGKLQGSILMMKDSLSFVVTGTQGETPLAEDQNGLVFLRQEGEPATQALPFALPEAE